MNKYNRIRDLREDSDKTQKEIADKLYLHLTQYRRYENGDSEIPLNIAIKISEIYDVSLDYVAGRTNDKNTKRSMKIDQNEKKLLDLFRRLNRQQRNLILELLNELRQAQ